jgi:hypothetical protein
MERNISEWHEDSKYQHWNVVRIANPALQYMIDSQAPILIPLDCARTEVLTEKFLNQWNPHSAITGTDDDTVISDVRCTTSCTG